MKSDNPKKQDPSDSNDCSANKKEADPNEFDCEPTVPILTLERDAVSGAEKDDGSDPYNSD